MKMELDNRKHKEKLRDIIETMCIGLVEDLDTLKVELVGSNSIILEISCSKGDVGKLIGKEGRNIQTLRNYANAFSSRYQFYTNIEIITENNFDKSTKYDKFNNKNYVPKNNYNSYGRTYNRSFKKFDRSW